MVKRKLFSEILQDNMLECPEQLAVVCGNMAYTHKELALAVDLFASDLAKAGVKDGDHVAVWSGNSVYWVVAYLGIVRAGGVAVLVNHGLITKDVIKLVRFTDVKYIAYGVCRENLSEMETRNNIAAETGISVENFIDIRQDFRARIENNEKPDVLPVENPDYRRDATIIFTSGSTAQPKAVLQSQYAYLCNSYGCREQLYGAYGKKVCPALPLFHSFGLYILLTYLGLGGTVYLIEKLDPNEIVNTLIEHQVTDMYSVAALYIGVMNHPRFAKEAAHLLHLCDVGGGVVTPEQMYRFSKAFPNAQFFCGYGQTEACMVISIQKPNESEENTLNTVGIAIPGVELKIKSTAVSSNLQTKSGEVMIRGDIVMNGYYKQPKELQPFDEDGWMHTGDLGYLDDNGYLHLTGRAKDLIIKSGENIVPSEIESKIMECKGVRDVKVIGVPHPVYGESVEACVVLHKNTEYTEKTIREEMLDKLNSFMMPSHFFVYDQFPLHANGKIDQVLLKEDVIMRIGMLSK